MTKRFKMILAAVALFAAAALYAQTEPAPRGTLDPDTGFVTDGNGYRYQYTEGKKLEMCAGGRYSGTITVPQAVNIDGKEVEVAGIAADAFRDNKEVTEVYYDRDTQYVGPSAFYRSGVRYIWDYTFSIPDYIYPSEDFSLYVRQEFPQYADLTDPQWMQFKHYSAHLKYVRDRREDESAQWGYSPWSADRMQGVYYEMDMPESARKDMFRGYDAQEVIGLACESRFLAMHRFPPFSRWKWGEKEQTMGATLEKQMETRYDRTLRQSRYIGNLREEDGRVGIFEFEPKDNEAMIVIAWVLGGKVKATYVQTTEIDPNEGEFSVWNVDDDGTYGIPNLLCVAFDHHDNVILFLEHGAPESRNMFGLRQQGDQFQLFGEEQWYVYVD